MANKPALTPVETLMQEIGLALLKFTNYELGEVKVTAETEIVVDVETDEEPKPKETKARGRKPKAEPVEEVEEVEEEDADDDDDEDDEGDDSESNELTEADLAKKTERQLRTIAIEMGYDKEDVKGADKETLINSILNPDEEEDEEAETETDSVDIDALVAKLEGMTLVAVKKVAREEYGFKAPDYKGMDKDAVIELIVEKISDSDVEDDDDDDEAPYTEEELDSMSMSELKSICKEWGIKIKIGEKKQAHIDAILDAQDES